MCRQPVHKVNDARVEAGKGQETGTAAIQMTDRALQTVWRRSVMKLLTFLFAIGALALVAGCTEPETYPLSGEECTPTDPVRELDPVTCLPV